jgi:para-aminobenzoate synthetase component 1
MSAAAANLPLVEPLPDGLTAVEAFMRLARQPRVVYFDSVAHDSRLGRYSFLAADPFEWIERDVGAGDPFHDIQRLCDRCQAITLPDLPPFQGGLAGMLGYDLGRTLEPILPTRYDDLPLPALALGAYDVVLAFDHVARRSWIISQGFPELDPAARRERAAARLAQFRAWLAAAPASCGLAPPAEFAEPTPASHLAPQFDVGQAGVTSNLSADDYRRMIRRGVEYVYAGDIFQVNLAQRLLCRADTNSVDLYLRLRDRNPAPYAGYFDLGRAQICSASPECFLTVRDRKVETRPIKGTRGRSHRPEADLFAGDELMASERTGPRT